MEKKALSTTNAPAALGPYSQGIQVGNTIYTSGQLGLDPASGQLPAGVEQQTHQAMTNLKSVLATAGADFSDVVKSNIFVADLNDFTTVNEIYASYLVEPYPARSTVQVARLPKDALVEIEMIAVVK